MTQMTPLPPEEPKRSSWIIPIAILAAVVIIGAVGYLAWHWSGDLREAAESVISSLGLKQTSSKWVPLGTVSLQTSALAMGGATVSPTEENTKIPTATSRPTRSPATLTPTSLPTETPTPQEASGGAAMAVGTPEANSSDEMPPTGIGPAFLIPIAMALALVLLFTRSLRTRFQR